MHEGTQSYNWPQSLLCDWPDIHHDSSQPVKEYNCNWGTLTWMPRNESQSSCNTSI